MFNSLRFFFLILLFTSTLLQAQVQFQKSIGYGEGYSVKRTSDGGFVIAGYNYNTTLIYNQVYIVKTNLYGDTLWTRLFGTDCTLSCANSEGFSISQTNDNGYIVSGYLDTTGFTAGDIYLIKLDSTGNHLWSKIYAGYTQDGSDPTSNVIQTADQGYIIAASGYAMDMAIIKTDVSGNVIWSKTLSYIDHNIGGQFIRQTTDGGFVVLGNTSLAGFNQCDATLVKLDSTGDIVWSKIYSASNIEYAESFEQTSDGGFIICGISGSFNPVDPEALLIKADSAGNILWAKTYGSSGYIQGHSVCEIENGFFVFAGEYVSPSNETGAFLCKVDSLGMFIWSKIYRFGNWDAGAYAVQQAADSGFIVVGYERTIGGWYLIKTNSMGLSGCNELNAVSPVSDVTFSIIDSLPEEYNSGTVLIPATNTFYTGIDTTLCSTVTGFVEMIDDDNLHSLSVNPNPFSYETKFSFKLNNRQRIVARICDVQLKTIEILADKFFEDGNNEIEWQGNIKAGMYFFVMESDLGIERLKLIVVK